MCLGSELQGKDLGDDVRVTELQSGTLSQIWCMVALAKRAKITENGRD